MEVPPREPDGTPSTTVTILVTGANSGLGYAICTRLIDEFLFTRPQSQTLHLLYTTRDTPKSRATLSRLDAHLQNTLKNAERFALGISRLLEGRVKIEGLLVDLTKLITVKGLAKALLLRRQRLDAVIWNAGIAGWTGVDFVRATRDLVKGIVTATTYPEFMLCNVGLLAKPQLAGHGSVHMFPEPKLGQVFTANVFGHYMLTHWLAPLLDAESRVVWITSISGTPETFSLEDMQGIRAEKAYESSKRLTDLLVMTADLPTAQPYVQTFLPVKSTNDSRDGSSAQRPQIYNTHPGVIATSISGVNWFIAIWMTLALYLSRWIGSPWHPVSAYKGAVSAVFAALAPPSQLADLELREGKGKWGSATDVFGSERVVRTEIEGWGFGPQLGVVPSGSVAAKRPGYRKTTRETREEFEVLGAQVWREMEELRVEWEKRLGRVEGDAREAVDL